jgi:hypothetical protein
METKIEGALARVADELSAATVAIREEAGRYAAALAAGRTNALDPTPRPVNEAGDGHPASRDRRSPRRNPGTGLQLP